MLQMETFHERAAVCERAAEAAAAMEAAAAVLKGLPRLQKVTVNLMKIQDREKETKRWQERSELEAKFAEITAAAKRGQKAVLVFIDGRKARDILSQRCEREAVTHARPGSASHRSPPPSHRSPPASRLAPTPEAIDDVDKATSATGSSEVEC